MQALCAGQFGKLRGAGTSGAGAASGVTWAGAAGGPGVRGDGSFSVLCSGRGPGRVAVSLRGRAGKWAAYGRAFGGRRRVGTLGRAPAPLVGTPPFPGVSVRLLLLFVVRGCSVSARLSCGRNCYLDTCVF